MQVARLFVVQSVRRLLLLSPENGGRWQMRFHQGTAIDD
ncbi:hypothetical protein B194_2639 [Serratia plymuthica A30]|nr:hypothetical protein B194_2639 [Serratia plymuthica A30]